MSQTKAQLIDPVDGTIVNADINASAAIAGTKISPVFGAQTITGSGGEFTGNVIVNGNNGIKIENSFPRLFLTDTDNNSDYSIINNNGAFRIFDDTNNATRIHISDAGLIGIGTTSPQRLLHLQSATSPCIFLEDTTQNSQLQLLAQDANVIVGTNTNHPLTFTINNVEKARIDTSGRLLLGTTNARVESNGFAAPLQVEGTGTATSSVIIARNSNNASSSNLIFQKSRGTSVGSNTVIQNGDVVGTIIFEGSDGTNTDSLASIIGVCDGTPGTNDLPGRLVFSTTADGAASPTERMRINQAGRVGINTTGPESELSVDGGVSISSNGVSVTPAGYDLKIRSNTSKLGIHTDNASGTPILEFGTGGATGGFIYTSQATPLRFGINTTERMRLHTGGELVIGHTTTTTNSNGENPFLQVKAPDSRAGASFIRHSADSSSGGIYLGKSRNATIGSNTIVQNGDELGRITFSGDDGTDIHTVAAEIKSFVDGTPGSNDMPGRLGFYTCPDGAAGAIERMRLDHGGRLLIGTTTNNNNAPLQVTTSGQVVGTFESTGADPQIYLGDNMASATDNAIILGYDRADNRGYLTVAGDGDTTLSIENNGLVGVGTSAPVERFGVDGNIRIVTATGTTKRITSKDTGAYTVGTTGGSAICFNRFSDAGGASDEIFFETHQQGVRHGTSLTITKEGFVTKPETPYFQAFGTANNQTYNGVVTLENAKYNNGGHWKTSSGTGQHQRFTAPVAGVYLFMFGFFPNTASTCRIELRLNGVAQTNPYISGVHSNMGSGFSMPSGAQILYCSANDYVEINISSGTLTDTYDGHTGFSGILLG